MNFIIDPTTGIKHSIFSSKGQKLLSTYYNKYINEIDGGTNRLSLTKRCISCNKDGFQSKELKIKSRNKIFTEN